MKNVLLMLVMMLCLSVDLFAQGVGQDPTSGNFAQDLLTWDTVRILLGVLAFAAIAGVMFWARKLLSSEAKDRKQDLDKMHRVFRNTISKKSYRNGIQGTLTKIRLLNLQIKDEERARAARTPTMSDANWGMLKSRNEARITELKRQLEWFNGTLRKGPRCFHYRDIQVPPEVRFLTDFASTREISAEKYSLPLGEVMTRRELWEALSTTAVGSISFASGNHILNASEKNRILAEIAHVGLEDLVRRPFQESWFKKFFPHDTSGFQTYIIEAIACQALLLTEAVGSERVRRKNAMMSVLLVDRADQLRQQRAFLDEICKLFEGRSPITAPDARKSCRKDAILGVLLAHLEIAAAWAQKGHSFGDVWVDTSDFEKLSVKWSNNVASHGFFRSNELDLDLMFEQAVALLRVYDMAAWLQGPESSAEIAQPNFTVSSNAEEP
jgi:hypothetical protein